MLGSRPAKPSIDNLGDPDLVLGPGLESESLLELGDMQECDAYYTHASRDEAAVCMSK
jgi:hypothetical protein